MALEVWRRVVSAKKPCTFDSSSGMLDLRTCSLTGDNRASRLSCKVAGSPTLTAVSLSESKPSSRIRSLFQENVEFTCNGGDILVVGALLPKLTSRGVKRKAAAVDAQAPTAKSAATASPVQKPATTPTAAEKSIHEGFRSPKLAPAPSADAKKEMEQWAKKKAEKRPISHTAFSSGLSYDVLKVGNGAMAARGKAVQVRYEGRLAADGQIFDSGVIKFRLGMGEVIRAWDDGIQGMLAGECRRLYAPHRLAYGIEGHPPTIPPGAALIFEVELLAC